MFIVYTDGGKRKGRGAYAFAIVEAHWRTVKDDYNGHLSGTIYDYGFGIIDPLLNSAEAEIIAAREAIIRIRDLGLKKCLIVSDNMYVIYGVRDPHKMMRNRDTYNHVWNPILERVIFDPLETMHVKGHQKQTLNTLCDFMCNEVLADVPAKSLRRKVHLFGVNKPFRSAIVRTCR